MVIPNKIETCNRGLFTLDQGFVGLNIIMISWIMIVFFPRWKHTKTLCLVPPVILAGLYTFSFICSISLDEPGDFFSFQGIVKAFKDPDIVFIGWVHYIVFDFLVGRGIVLDSIEIGVSRITHFVLIVPILFFTLMVGPVGFLLYMLARPLLISDSSSSSLANSSNSQKKSKST